MEICKMQKKFLRSGRQNMEYSIKFTGKCLNDIDEICKYISDKLKAEKSANRLRIKIKDIVKELSTFPEMYARIDKMDRLKREYRRIPINNYIILYSIDKKKKIIYISHMYYGGRNYLEGLI